MNDISLFLVQQCDFWPRCEDHEQKIEEKGFAQRGDLVLHLLTIDINFVICSKVIILSFQLKDSSFSMTPTLT